MPNNEISPTMTNGGIDYYSVKDALRYTGLSNNGLYKRIDRFNEQHQDNPIQKFEFGGRARFYKKQDLDRLFEMRPVE